MLFLKKAFFVNTKQSIVSIISYSHRFTFLRTRAPPTSEHFRFSTSRDIHLIVHLSSTPNLTFRTRNKNGNPTTPIYCLFHSPNLISLMTVLSIIQDIRKKIPSFSICKCTHACTISLSISVFPLRVCACSNKKRIKDSIRLQLLISSSVSDFVVISIKMNAT